MKYYLIETEADYADEFYVRGMCVLTEKEFEELNNTFSKYLERERKRKEKVKNKEVLVPLYYAEYEFYFGTNEFLSFESVEEIRDTYEIKEISEEQYKILKELNLLNFGETTLIDIFFDGRLEEQMEDLEEIMGINNIKECKNDL